MPIYEFYCASCHRLFSFLARRVDTTSQPPCPDCRRRLSRQVSLFASLRKGGEDADTGADDSDGLPPDVDEDRVEHAMEGMADEFDSIDEDDPRQAAHAMRRFAKAGGLRFNRTVDEALGRMEAGEAPEDVEKEFGDELDQDNPFETGPERGRPAGRGKRRSPPTRDARLYDL
jgi:putative FmdB family regulatory protein